MYRIDYLREAVKDLRKLDRQGQDCVREGIGKLADEPRPHGVVKLTSKHGLYRIRVGDYRVLYRVSDEARLVHVVRIGPRGDVYKER